jgi:hypothetical protein
VSPGSDRVLVQERLVDVSALQSLAHACDPALCRDSGSCCACYDVWIGDVERERILALLPHARRLAGRLPSDPGEIVRQIGPGAYALRRDDAGLCTLAYRAPGGEVLCSLHSAALERGLAPDRVKPESCTLWPLSLTSSDPPVLSVHEDGFSFPCNVPREGASGSLDPGVARTVRAAFGEEFLRELQRLVAETGSRRGRDDRT